MDSRRALSRAIAHDEVVRIERRGGDLPTVYGFPLALGRSLVLVRDVTDFDVCGFMVLPLRDVTEVRSRDCERFLERVLRDERQLRAALHHPRVPLRLNGWGDVFSPLAAAGEIAIVECEADGDQEFSIGLITGVSDGAVGIHQFDATAVWDPSPTVVPYAEITHVRFDERYTHVFARYLGDTPSG